MFGNNRQRESATGGKASFHAHVPGMTGDHQIVQNAVDDGFIKRMDIAIGSQIQLERFGFQAARIRNVFDKNLGKIRLAGHGAKRREIGAINADGKIPVNIRIGKRLQCGLLRRFREGGLGVAQQRQRGVWLVFFLVLHGENSMSKIGRLGEAKIFSPSDDCPAAQGQKIPANPNRFNFAQMMQVGARLAVGCRLSQTASHYPNCGRTAFQAFLFPRKINYETY